MLNPRHNKQLWRLFVSFISVLLFEHRKVYHAIYIFQFNYSWAAQVPRNFIGSSEQVVLLLLELVSTAKPDTE